MQRTGHDDAITLRDFIYAAFPRHEMRQPYVIEPKRDYIPLFTEEIVGGAWLSLWKMNKTGSEGIESWSVGNTRHRRESTFDARNLKRQGTFFLERQKYAIPNCRRK